VLAVSADSVGCHFVEIGDSYVCRVEIFAGCDVVDLFVISSSSAADVGGGVAGTTVVGFWHDSDWFGVREVGECEE
jgi:hypothetical protein